MTINFIEEWICDGCGGIFDKTEMVEGKLLGIKGQYLIFDNGVINIRKFTSYEVSVDSE